MKAHVIKEFGGIDSIHVEDIPIPVPHDNEVLIKIQAAGINPVDWKISEGYVKDRLPFTFPITLGWDAAGTIAGYGKEVHNFREGEKVFAYTRKEIVHHGTFAEYVTVPADVVAPMPKGYSFVEAASVPLAALTAWQSLFDAAHLQPDETILIHAASGGVGGFAVQFAKKVEAEVIATARAKNHDYVQSLGADFVIDYAEQDFVDEVRKKYPEGVDVVFDCVAGEVQNKSYSVVKRGGRLISIVQPPDMQMAEEFGVQVGFVFVHGDGEQLNTIKTLIEQGEVQIPSIQEVSWDNLKEALRQSQKGHTRGKLVLHVNT